MTTQRWSASTLVGKLKHELRQIGLVTLYFFFCFGVGLTLKKLLLAHYQIEFYAMSATVVGALVAAKIVVVLDKTRAGARFDATRPLWLSVLYKTVVYSLVAAAPPELRRSGLAYDRLWSTGTAADVLVWTREAFDSRLHLRASLPATILREGTLLYAA